MFLPSGHKVDRSVPGLTSAQLLESRICKEALGLYHFFYCLLLQFSFLAGFLRSPREVNWLEM